MIDQNQPKAAAERKKLTILTVGVVVKVGNNNIDKLSFKAKDGNKEYSYFTFNAKLFDIIQKGIGQTIEFDIENSITGEYTNRKVIQAYVNGEPVAAKKGTFGGYRGKSPEEIRSIEVQCAFKMVTELIIAGKIPDTHPLYKNLLSWLNMKTSASLKL